MSNTFFYLQRSVNTFSINLTNFSGETILLGRETEEKYDYKKYLQSLKTHLCFNTNYCRTRNSKGYYGFEIRTCWDELIAQSIFFETRDEREKAMSEVFLANKVAELREIAISPYTIKTMPIAS